MSRPSDDRFLALHELRVKGLAEAPDAGDDLLADLAQADLVQRRDGVVSGWRLTTSGRVLHDQLLAADTAGVETDLHDAYLRFLALNPTLLELCTDAQLQADVDVADRLRSLHADVLPVIDALATALTRFAVYRDRFAAALARVTEGDRGYLARPVVDSYHTIWSELHEDLLSTLRVARGSEPVVAAREGR